MLNFIEHKNEYRSFAIQVVRYKNINFPCTYPVHPVDMYAVLSGIRYILTFIPYFIHTLHKTNVFQKIANT